MRVQAGKRHDGRFLIDTDLQDTSTDRFSLALMILPSLICPMVAACSKEVRDTKVGRTPGSACDPPVAQPMLGSGPASSRGKQPNPYSPLRLSAGAFTPFTRSHSITDACPRSPQARFQGDRWFASGVDRKVSQAKPANAITAPRIRGRKVDL